MLPSRRQRSCNAADVRSPIMSRSSWARAAKSVIANWPCGGVRIRADDLATAVWTTIFEALKDETLLANHIWQLAQGGQQGNQLDADLKAAKHAIAVRRRRAVDLVRHSDPCNATLWDVVQQEVKSLDQEVKEWEAVIKDIEKR